MTSTIARPETTAQDVLSMNVNLMVSARHIQKKDVAHVIGVQAQTVARKLRGEITWTINEAAAVAKYLGVSVDTLLRPNLTTSELVGLHGLEPWTDEL